jgi:hypothetical protein
VNLENLLNGRSQPPKCGHFHLYEMSRTGIRSRFLESECPKGWGGIGACRVIAVGYLIFLWGNENVPKLLE